MTIPEMPAGPDVPQPPGDPDALNAAALWHDTAAERLAVHANTVYSSQHAALQHWEGDAATSYARLSGEVTVYLRSAADQSQHSAGLIRSVSSELARCQHESRAALRQAEHFYAQAKTDRAHIITAQQGVTSAQQALSRAQSTPVPGVIGAQQLAISAAQRQLHTAQGTLSAAQRAFESDTAQLTHYNRLGHRLYEEAEQAVAGLSSLPTSIATPPVAHPVTTTPTGPVGGGGIATGIGAAGGSAGTGATGSGTPTGAGGAPTGGGGGAGSIGEVTPAMLKKIAAEHGWDAAQITAWREVIERESGGNPTATNPSSGAYGIAQFINGAGEYAEYGGNSTTVVGQLTSMANYISQRYGNPAGAWAHELSAGWY